jgi:hypothetical protein
MERRRNLATAPFTTGLVLALALESMHRYWRDDLRTHSLVHLPVYVDGVLVEVQ